MKIGVIDFGLVPEQSNAVSYIQELLDEAVYADQLGFSRFWITEHFQNGCAWKSPEIILTLLAGYTQHIRIGVAGVLLPVHNTLLVAQQYKLLNNLFNNRVDLGLARGIPPEEMHPYLIGHQPIGPIIGDQFNRVLQIKNMLQEDHIPILPPWGGDAPELWVLGTSFNSLDFVTEHELSFSLSLFHPGAPDIDLNQLKTWEHTCQEQKKAPPKFVLALSVICEDDAQKLGHSIQRFQEVYKDGVKLNLTGSYAYIEDKLNEYKERYGIDEFALLNGAVQKEDREIFYTRMSKIITPVVV